MRELFRSERPDCNPPTESSTYCQQKDFKSGELNHVVKINHGIGFPSAPAYHSTIKEENGKKAEADSTKFSRSFSFHFLTRTTKSSHTCPRAMLRLRFEVWMVMRE